MWIRWIRIRSRNTRNNKKNTKSRGKYLLTLPIYSTKQAETIPRCTLPTYGVGLIDVAAGREEEVGDALGSAEGGPVQRDVHLHVRHEGVSALLQQVADHNLVSARGGGSFFFFCGKMRIYNRRNFVKPRHICDKIGMRNRQIQ